MALLSEKTGPELEYVDIEDPYAVLELKLPGESAHAGGGAAVADANRAAAIAAAVAAAAGQRSGGYRQVKRPPL